MLYFFLHLFWPQNVGVKVEEYIIHPSDCGAFSKTRQPQHNHSQFSGKCYHVFQKRTAIRLSFLNLSYIRNILLINFFSTKSEMQNDKTPVMIHGHFGETLIVILF